MAHITLAEALAGVAVPILALDGRAFTVPMAEIVQYVRLHTV